MDHIDATELKLNEVAMVAIHLSSPVAFDPYKASPGTGSLIIIDRMSNITIAAGMIESEIDAVIQPADMPYQQRLSAFNQEMAELVRKYFPEK